MPGDVGDFSVNIGLGINFLAFVSQFVTLRDTLSYPNGIGLKSRKRDQFTVL